MSEDLSQAWKFGEQIGGGGFARVVKAYDSGGVVHAAKFVKKEPGASREMLLANLKGVRNIVPVVDSGVVGDEYVLVMPMADVSLRDYIAKGAPLKSVDALNVLKDIATALSDLDGKVVHRDIKPENILLMNGRWCLADFGISRYADAVTEAGVTRKRMMTPLYAAPEQWRWERATSQTDVYAFGIIAFEVLEGRLPFLGTEEELREYHCHADPPEMTVGTSLQSLVLECLYKEPQARPSAANLVRKLERATDPASTSRWERLSAANHAEVRRRAVVDAVESRAVSEHERRAGLFVAAASSWRRISGRMQDLLDEHLSAAKLEIRPDNNWHATLNGAKFGFSYPQVNSASIERLGFDVIATSTSTVLVPDVMAQREFWIGRSHSLFFADALVAGQYEWFETAFMHSGVARKSLEASAGQVPFAINDLMDEGLHQALGNGLGVCQVAWPFTPVEAGDRDEFADRWLGWFAQASQELLTRPSRLPEEPISRNWR